MQRTLRLALATVLGAALVVPALAQDNFPDVPDNHWAYEALLRMKSNGLLVGYPDGLFRGNRPASRYELAVAIHATYVNLKNITDGLQAQIDAIDKKGDSADLANLRTALANLQNDVNNLKRYGDDIAALRRLTDTFQKELQDLNVDVEQMKKDLGDLNARVTKLEANRPAVDIHGDGNLWIGSGMATGNRAGDFGGLNKDGRRLGVMTGGGQTSSPIRDLTVLHEGALTFTTTKEKGPKLVGTVVVGNMLNDKINQANGTAFLDQSRVTPAYGSRYTEGVEDIYIQDLAVKFDSSVAGLGFNAEVGRIGYKISPYILQRLDNTTYFANDRWDNGKYIMDGAVVGFNFGGAKLDLFGGRTSRRFTTQGNELQPYVTGSYNVSDGNAAFANSSLRVDQTIGARLNVPVGQNGNVDVSYLILDNSTADFKKSLSAGGGIAGTENGNSVRGNRIGVFGATGDFKFGSLKVAGGYTQTQLMEDDSTTGRNRDNQAYYGTLGYSGNRFGLEGTYREVQARFLAPGDWGRLGIIRNPQNIRGFQVKGHFDVSDALTIKASGEFDKGASDNFRASTGLDKDSKIDTFNVGLDFKVSSSLGLMLGYEEARFKNVVNPGAVNGPRLGETKYRWTTVGLGYGLSDTAKLSIAYEFSDHANEYIVGGINQNGQGRNFRGGFFTTQLSVKF
ncbi:hypothetical protein EON81_20825 [bacterium]|nr:MAG: hypothetical protein EON81_20825 [bacterium]